MEENEMCKCSPECHCEDGECVCGEEDVASEADDKVDALINLLVKKGIVTMDEIQTEYDALYPDDEEEEVPESVTQVQ